LPFLRHGAAPGAKPVKNLMRALTLVLVLCLAALGALVYDWPAPKTAPAAPSTASRQDEASGGGEFSLLNPPRPAPELAFTARDGTPKRLADFRGRVVLVNLWATWCGPCVEEMPSLDRLQAQFGDALAVLAISEDRPGESVVAPFLAKHKIGHLAVYLDVRNDAIKAFGVQGLPTSFLIGRDGRIIAMLEGAAQWDEPAMIARLKPYLETSKPPTLEKTSLTR
jgi:thiol-disulfide isomerase/thioredoxin